MSISEVDADMISTRNSDQMVYFSSMSSIVYPRYLPCRNYAVVTDKTAIPVRRRQFGDFLSPNYFDIVAESF